MEDDEEVILPDYREGAYNVAKRQLARFKLAAETRWDHLERAAEGWHFVMVKNLTEERSNEMINWAHSNVSSGCHFHMENFFGPNCKGIALFESKTDAALFKTMFCHG